MKGFVDEVVIAADGAEIARHRRSYEPGDMVYNPRHYLALIEIKPGALDQAAPLQGWDLPPGFAEMRRFWIARPRRQARVYPDSAADESAAAAMRLALRSAKELMSRYCQTLC